MGRVLTMVAALSLVAAPPTHAKCCALTTPPAPADLQAGEKWVAQIELTGDRSYWPDESPTLIAWSDSTHELVSVQAKRSARDHVYHAHVAFPQAGTWFYAVTFGGFRASISAPLRDVTVVSRESRDYEVVFGAAGLLVAGVLLVRLLALSRRVRARPLDRLEREA